MKHVFVFSREMILDLLKGKEVCVEGKEHTFQFSIEQDENEDEHEWTQTIRGESEL